MQPFTPLQSFTTPRERVLTPPKLEMAPAAATPAQGSGLITIYDGSAKQEMNEERAAAAEQRAVVLRQRVRKWCSRTPCGRACASFAWVCEGCSISI